LGEIVIGHGLLDDVKVLHQEAVQRPEVMKETQEEDQD
jgi:hypothetical protein